MVAVCFWGVSIPVLIEGRRVLHLLVTSAFSGGGSGSEWDGAVQHSSAPCQRFP